jgi:predicted lipoprotein with Yx(FWY)xxD motif
MTDARRADRTHGRERAIAIVAGAVAMTSTLAIAFVAVALAASTLTVGSASNAKLGKRVVVDSKGRTLYFLSGESKSHQICTSAECLRFWPPLKVSSKSTKLKDGSGVHGKLAIVSRSGGHLLQVMLRGMPLYRYAGDKGKGEANGDGIEFPGGHVWHAVTAAGNGASNTAPTPAPQAPNPTPPPVTHYPGY